MKDILKIRNKQIAKIRSEDDYCFFHRKTKNKNNKNNNKHSKQNKNKKQKKTKKTLKTKQQSNLGCLA